MTSVSALPRLVEGFFRLHLVARRNASPHTVRAYRDALRALLRFAGARCRRHVSTMELDHVDRTVILAFLDDLETTRGNAVRTRNCRLAAIHSFFRFVVDEEPQYAELCRQVLSIPYKRHENGSITCLGRDDIEHILAAPDRTTPSGRRDAALLLFLYNTGARAQEVVDLQIPAVRLNPPAQVRLLGKGRKERLCPLWTETVVLIQDMLRDRGVRTDAEDALFVNATRRPLTRFGLHYIVRSCVARAATIHPSLAQKRISPHTFRHSTALHLLQSGIDISVVRSWLGHASVTTTHEYVEIDIEMKRAALEAAMPPKGPRRPPCWQEPDLLQWLDEL